MNSRQVFLDTLIMIAWLEEIMIKNPVLYNNVITLYNQTTFRN